MKEMLVVGREKGSPPLRMPAELMSRLNALYSRQKEDHLPAKPLSRLSEWLNKYTSVPVLALGAAAALLISAALIVPVWRSLKEARQLEFVPSQEARPVSQPEDARFRAAAPSRAPGETPPAAPESRKLKDSKIISPLPLDSAPEGEQDKLPKTRAYSAKPGFLREEGEETASTGTSSRRDRAVKTPAAGLPMKRPPVLLSIEGPEGQPLPALASAIPAALRQRFDFVDQAVDEARAEKRKDIGSLEKKAEHRLRKLPDRPIQITVKVTRTDNGFTVTAKKFEKGSTDATKSITDLDVPVEKLPEEVGRIVGDLLVGR